jgi:hypothetical protein
MTILEPYSVLVDEGFELQGELQPGRWGHSSRGGFGEAGTEPGGSVASEPGSQKPVGSFSLSCACARVFCSPVWPGKSGGPILYDKVLNPGAAIILGSSAQLKQLIGAPHVAFQCTNRQPLYSQLEPRCPLRSSAFAVSGGSVQDLADDVVDKLGFALSPWTSCGITRNTLFKSRMLGRITTAGFTHRPNLPYHERRNPCCNRYPRR